MKKTCFFLYICVKVWYRQHNCLHWKRAADMCTMYTLPDITNTWISPPGFNIHHEGLEREHIWIKAHQIYFNWLFFLGRKVIFWDSTAQFDFLSSQLYLNYRKVGNQENNSWSQNMNSWKLLSPYSSQGCVTNFWMLKNLLKKFML